VSLDLSFLLGFLTVFLRFGAAFLAAPFFGGGNVSVQVRVLCAAAIALALGPITPVVAPQSLLELAMWVGQEVLSGLAIGFFFGLITQAAQVAGAIIDLQMGLALSQALNPLTGVPVTVLAQFKVMLCAVLLFITGGHHLLIRAAASSYTVMPLRTDALPATAVEMVAGMFLVAMQLAAPVLAVTFLIDVALGVMTRAVPQMQALVMGVAAKTLLSLVVLSAALPALTLAVDSGLSRVGAALQSLGGQP
jgi:flagellar biosynthetic protein FliR